MIDSDRTNAARAWLAAAVAWRDAWFAVPEDRNRLAKEAGKLWRKACELDPENAPKSRIPEDPP